MGSQSSFSEIPQVGNGGIFVASYENKFETRITFSWRLTLHNK